MIPIIDRRCYNFLLYTLHWNIHKHPYFKSLHSGESVRFVRIIFIWSVGFFPIFIAISFFHYYYFFHSLKAVCRHIYTSRHIFLGQKPFRLCIDSMYTSFDPVRITTCQICIIADWLAIIFIFPSSCNPFLHRVVEKRTNDFSLDFVLEDRNLMAVFFSLRIRCLRHAILGLEFSWGASKWAAFKERNMLRLLFCSVCGILNLVVENVKMLFDDCIP